MPTPVPLEEWRYAGNLLSSTWFREKDSPDLSEPLKRIAGYIPSVLPIVFTAIRWECRNHDLFCCLHSALSLHFEGVGD